MEMQKRRMCIQWEVKIQDKQTIMRMRASTETRYTKHRASTRRVAARGTPITLTFHTRPFFSLNAGAITAVLLLLACFLSVPTMAAGVAMFRSVRSWSHFKRDHPKYTSKWHKKALKTARKTIKRLL